jgi:hypothetical protein
MMLKRLIFLQVILAGGLSLIFLLPKAPPLQNSAISLDLPNVLIMSGWGAGKSISPSGKELDILAKDTEFSRRNYYRSTNLEGQPGAQEVIQASIVLSGKDPNNSLHRPERCLPAQGLNLLASSELPVVLKGGQQIKLTKLKCSATDPSNKSTYTHLNYYLFVGHDSIQHTHYGRTGKDMRDRLMEGYDQRWAYLTISSNLIKVVDKDEDGKTYLSALLTEEETDRDVAEFVAELAPEIIDMSAIKSIGK